MDIAHNLFTIAPTNIFANDTDEEANEHGHNDIHLDPGDPQGAEAQDQSQGNYRQDSVEGRCSIRFVLNGFDVHGFNHMSITLIHVFLSEVMQHANNYEGYSNDRNLIMAPVENRVHTGSFSGQNGAGITGAPVEAEGSSYSRSCRQARNAQANQNGEHGYHQQHSQAGGTVNAQTDEHTYNPGAAHNDIGRF